MATTPAASKKKSAASSGGAKTSAKSAAGAKAPSRSAPQKQAAATTALKTVFEEMADGHNIPRKQANALLATMVKMVTKHLKNGDRIRMNGLGILEVKDRPAQMGRNPGTGQPIQIAASKKVAFHVAKELKDACRTSSKTPPFNGGGQFAARVFLSDLDAQLEAFALAQGAPPR